MYSYDLQTYCKSEGHIMKYSDKKTGDVVYICPISGEKEKVEKEKKYKNRVK